MGVDGEQFQLGFNALHHSVQSYADTPANAHTNSQSENQPRSEPGPHLANDPEPNRDNPEEGDNNDHDNNDHDNNEDDGQLKSSPPPNSNLSTHLQSLQSILATPWGKEACLQQTRDGHFTPLHLCCRSIVPDQITTLIATANPQAISMQDEEGDTPLHSAFRYGASEEIIRSLIELAYNHSQTEEEEQDHIQHQLHLHNQLHLHQDHLHHLHHQDAECTPFSKLNDDGESSLHTAISHEASGTSVKLLLDAYPQGILACNGRLQSPLHVACETGRYDIIDVILQSHASIDSVDALLKVKDESGLTPIFILWRQVCAIHRTCATTSRLLADDGETETELMLEILDCIMKLLKSTESYDFDKISSCHSSPHCRDNAIDIHNDLSNYKSNSNSSSELVAYQLLKTCICLGSNVVPGGYVAFLVKYNPEILFQADPNGLLPLHLATMKYQESSHNYDNEENEEVYYQHACPSISNDTSTTLHDNDNECFPLSLDTKILNYTHDLREQHEHRYETDDTLFIDIILNANNSAAFCRDKAGKLPLHLAIDAGVSWRGLENFIKVNPLAIQDKDPITGLLPFMSAAKANSNEEAEPNSNNNCSNLLSLCRDGRRSTSSTCRVDAIFRLLRSSPDAILPTLDKCDRYCTLESPPRKKRRRIR